MINDKLSYNGRYLRTHTGKLLFGPSGRRLFVDYLTKAPGFVGRIDFIHKINIPSLFTVTSPYFTYDDFDTAQTCWYPSMLTMELENRKFAFSETKFITGDDIAVSVQKWTNKRTEPLILDITVEFEETEMTVHGFRIGMAFAADYPLTPQSQITLLPGETVRFTAAAALGNLETEDMASIKAKVRGYIETGGDFTARHNEQYNSFYDNAPSFECSDKVLETAWNYRLFLLKHNLFYPDFGLLHGAVMYEGRSHKKSKKPFAPGGWEFSKLINLSTPLHLMDFRWHHDKQASREIIMNMIKTRDKNGIFCSAFVSQLVHSYANFGVWAVYKFHLVDGCKDFISGIIADLKDYIANESAFYGSASDSLQIEKIKHSRTGKEYQPSYWYFHNYPKNPKDMTTYTPLKRVDRSIYHYLNTLGLARLCASINDADAARYLDMAESVKTDVLTKMWDTESRFFYDLHHETDEKALVKNIVGIYPYWADITDSETLSGLEHLFDKQLFGTPFPFPSVAKDCPAYRPGGSWMDNYIKGKNGCVWCGPSWPYTNGIAVDAIGIQSKRNNHKYDAEFARLLRKYALQHFRDGDITRPYLVEHYDAETGEPISDEPDYNHSYFMELIISHVCGLEITDTGVTFDPVNIGVDYFKLDNLKIRNDTYTVIYDKGYTFYKNGIQI